MQRAAVYTAEPIACAPLRSEAFAEDLTDDEMPAAAPWTLSQAALAALLCAVPAVLAAVGGAVTLAA